MTYELCKRIIELQKYDTKEEMIQKLDVFLLANRITEDEYNELVSYMDTMGWNSFD